MSLAENYLLFSIIVALGVFVQSAAGFAAGLVIISLMGYSGFGIPEAQTVVLVATIPQNVMGLYKFQHSIKPNELALPALLRFISLPAGLFCLWIVDGLPLMQIRQFLGVVVFLGVILLTSQGRWDPGFTARGLHRGWLFLAFLSSGFFAGLTGTGGPMMVVWVQAHNWSTERSRAFLFGMYLIYTFPGLFLLWLTFGNRVTTAAASVVLLTPALIAASWCGLRFGSWLGRHRLRRVTVALLCLIAFLGVFSPLLPRP